MDVATHDDEPRVPSVRADPLGSARRLGWKLGRTALTIVVLGAGMPWVESEAVRTVAAIGLILVLLPLLVLRVVDLGGALRELPTDRPVLRAVGLALGLPEALLGLASMGIGVAIVAWVVYNTFVDRLPEFTGHVVFRFGIGPTLITFGWLWLRRAFERRPE